MLEITGPQLVQDWLNSVSAVSSGGMTDGLGVAVDAAALARVGTALADENRRRLLLALLEEPAFPSDLADRLEMTRGNVSNHLACLRGCGLVRTVPVGRRVRYELADPRLAHALAELATLVLLVDHEDVSDEVCGPEDYDCPPDEVNHG
ncbi:DNA-binding transcriptional ArsR family regulator [Kribbella amoyensis]|uniref:DNA-binding transcriptional ArsR family regulator n=1 Tax=Kribbella amoyensis TaxID=996641 RepID=A0A561B2D3_9ACTN|nr:metalloregulator ArsR/SmtB family transcription factor [Kribbella amoyensis]TWD73025.1 DNA-binding transcriptional ArsR family regulator [Kribbella amoyensis]